MRSLLNLAAAFSPLALSIFLTPALTSGTEFPHADISNRQVKATLYLPDRDRGYYRGSRFDWSGVIPKLEYAGHSYFGVWFPKYDPYLHDAIVGPVEEFRSEDGALGFAEAKPGGMFVKIGVGVLRKPDDREYVFSRPYKLLSEGQWIVRPYNDRVEFVQELKGVDGYSYIYSKTVRLDGSKPILTLEHKLKNTGKRTIDTAVYNHDFYVIDNQPTGPGFSIQFPFHPQAQDDLKSAAEIKGDKFLYRRELAPERDTVSTYLTGYGATPKDNSIAVENSTVGAGVREIGSRPISKLFLWSIRTTVCPEAYISLHIAPGKTAKWKIAYQFYTLDKKAPE